MVALWLIENTLVPWGMARVSLALRTSDPMCCAAELSVVEPIAKVSSQLVQHNRRLDARAKPLSGALSIWLMRYATATMRDVKRKLKAGGYSALERSYVEKRIKASELHKLESDLRTLLIRYGLAQAEEAGKAAAREVGERWVIKPSLLDAVARQKENKVVLIVEQTQGDVRASLKRLLADAMAESPRPTTNELGRRIARSWFGEAMRAPTGDPAIGLRGLAGTDAGDRALAAQTRLTADWARSAKEATKDSEHLFGFQRAYTIARAETAQTRSMGQAIAYSDVGIERVGWLAYPNDGRSGKRKHWIMTKHKPITVAAMNGTDQSKWFHLPYRGKHYPETYTPHPNWIGMAVGDLVH